MLKHSFSLICFLCVNLLSFSQEVRCDVEVNAQQISNVDQSLVQTMEQSITEFINSKKWSGDQFKDFEQIEFNLLLNLENRIGNETWEASLQIQSRRPVFGTSYTTPMISFMDNDVVFNFSQFANLEFSETQFLSNLTSVLAYYVYMVMAYDYDSFKKKGGDVFLQKAQTLVNNAQGSDYPGWDSDSKGEKNRYWIVENHRNARTEGFRNCLYEYHRLGLDKMESSPDEARKAILSALEQLRPVFQNRPNSINLRIFFNAKYTEIVKIFEKSDEAEKRKAVDLLTSLDPANATKYNEILKNN